MTTKRKIALAVVGLIIMSVASGGVLLYRRLNRGDKLLARAKLAMRAEDPAKALNLVETYISKHPSDWKGYYVKGQAYIRQGKYVQARKPLIKARELDSNEPAVVIAHADTYAMPAARVLSTEKSRPTVPTIIDAIAGLDESVRILESFKPDNEERALAIKETIGLNYRVVAEARDKLATKLADQAKVADASRNADVARAKSRASKQASQEADANRRTAIRMLLEVVKRTPSREKAAEPLVAMCLKQDDIESLAEAKAALAEADPAPPIATMTLLTHELMKLPDHTSTAFAKKLDAAIEQLDALLEAHPDNARLKLRRAEFAMEKSDTETASRLASELLKVEKRHSQAQLLLARVLIARGKYADAESKLYLLRGDFANSIRAHYWYAVAADATGKKELAMTAMRTVTDLEPLSVSDRLLVSMARKYLARKLLVQYPEKALDDARKCHESDPNDPDALLMMVTAALATNRHELALDTLDNAQADAEAPARMLLAVYRGYDTLGNPDKAANALNRAANIEPKDADERYDVARAMLLSHRSSDAMRLANEAIGEDPESPKAHHVMALVYAFTKRSLQAREHLRKAVALASREPRYRIDLAASLRKTGELEEAVEVLAPTVATNEKARELQLNIKILQAKPDQLAATTHGTGKLLSKLQLAQIYLSKGQAEKCIEICSAELERQHGSYNALMLIGQAFLATNQIDRCVEAWTPLIAARPEELSIYQHLAGALKRQAGPQAGPPEVHKLLAATPGARMEMVNAAIASLCRQSGRFLDAAGFYDEAAGEAGGDQAMLYTARRRQAECLAKANKSDEALGIMDQLLADENLKTERKSILAAKAEMLVRLKNLPKAQNALDKLLKAATEDRSIPYLQRVVETFVRIWQTDRDPKTRDKWLNKALEACDAIRSVRPTESSGYVLRAWVMEKLGKLEQAGQQYQKAIEINPAELNIHVRLADNLDARLKPVEALAALGKLDDLGQAGQSQSLFSQAILYRRWGLTEPAIERIKALYETAGQSGSPKVQLDLSGFMASVGLADRAKALLVKIPEHAREYVPAHLLLAELADTPDKKLAILRDLENRTLATPEILARKMEALMADGKPAEAMKEFHQFGAKLKTRGVLPLTATKLALAAAIETRNLPLAAKTAEMLSRGGTWAQWTWIAAALAIDVDANSAGKLLREPKQATGLTTVLGYCSARKTGDANAAAAWASRLDETLYNQSANQPSSSSQADKYRLLCALLIGEESRVKSATDRYASNPSVWSKAAGELADYREKNPSRAPEELIRLIQAEVAFSSNSRNLARLWATDALKARPTCQWAAALLVQIADKPSRLDEVATLLKPADCYLARIVRARVFKEAREYSKAIEVYESFSPAEKKELGLAMEQGQVEERAGNLEKALGIYLRVWQDSENRYAIAANNAAYIIAKLHPKDPKQLEEARKLAETAKKAMPMLPHHRDTVGWIAYLQGDTAKACEMLRYAVKGMPGSAEVHYHVGVAEAAAGNRGLGRMHLAEAVRIGKELRKADAKLESSETEAADLASQALIDIEPE